MEKQRKIDLPIPGFIDRLRELMEAKKLSGAALGKIAGVSKQSFSNYLSGAMPTASVLYAWSIKLDVNANWLLTGEGDMLRMANTAAEVLTDAERGELELLRQERIRLRDELLAVQKEHMQLLTERVAALGRFAPKQEEEGETLVREVTADYDDVAQEPFAAYAGDGREGADGLGRLQPGGGAEGPAPGAHFLRRASDKGKAVYRRACDRPEQKG